MDELSAELESAEVDNHENRPFVPFTTLQSLLTESKVLAILQKSRIEFHHVEGIAHRILEGGLRTFAILVKIWDMESITRFIRADQFTGGLLDSKLPLGDTEAPSYLSSSAKASQFVRKQWIFLAPVFADDSTIRELDHRAVLPFVKSDFIREGAFGKISKVKVYASHHKLSNTATEIELVCKQLTGSRRYNSIDDFENEVRILSALRCLQHPNIINLVAAFSQGTSHTFLFPVADGDLHQILQSVRRPQGLQTESEILSSTWGLCSALQSVHEYFYPQMNIHQTGCHYDIKPNNILHRNGILLLSDFGLSRLRDVDSNSQSTFKAGETSWLAPECESVSEGFTPQKIGRASDIWSFGCVLAVLLAYLSSTTEDGPRMVEEFRLSRRIKARAFVIYPFHNFDRDNAGTKNLLEHMKIDESVSWSLSSLAQVASSILTIEPSDRPSAKDLVRILFHIAIRSRVSLIEQALDDQSAPVDLELDIESKRFKVWAQIVGLRSDLFNVSDSAWLGTSHSLREYQDMESKLARIEAEVGVVMDALNKLNPRKPTFRLYYRLQKLQDELWEVHSTEVRREMLSRVEEALLGQASAAYLTEISNIVSNADSGAENTTGPDVSVMRVYRRFISLETMRDVAASMAKRTHSSDLQHQQLEPSAFTKPQFDLKLHTVKTIQATDQLVLLEKIAYEEGWANRVPELLDRVKAVSSLRSQDVIKSVFPVLQCHGYYHDPLHFNFEIVYKLPAIARNTVPIDLTTAITKTQSRNLQPSLTQRYKLAATLVAHMLSFHRGGWLHKSISSFNIIFFPGVYSSTAASLDSPYFVGFNHARMNDEAQISTLLGAEEDYQHPVYLRNPMIHGKDTLKPVVRFCQEFDYYSTGMVLLEIALWKSLGDITKSIRGAPEEVLNQILTRIIPLIRVYMGDLYTSAVNHCLTAYKEGSQPPEQVREAFDKEVVAPISRCVV